MRGRSTSLLASICTASLLDIGLRTGSLQPAQGIVCDILCQQEQRVALVDIFDSANFHLLDWSDNTTTAAGGLPGHCRWPGVGCCNATGYLYTAGAGPDLDAAFSSLPCNISGAVSLLALPGLGLSGSLPQAAKSWQALGSSMEYLGLQNNFITGPIPGNLSLLTKLIAIDLSFNFFSGELPPLLLNHSTLRAFKAVQNRLQGRLPSMAGIPAITTFMVGLNAISGTIPDDWSSPIGLQVYAVDNNLLTGTLPGPKLKTLGDLGGSTLQLRLANNKLSGTIPVSLTYLSVCYLDVSHNAMTGSLGYAMNMLTAFELYLDHNAFTGFLPVFHAIIAQAITINDNQLSGTLPPMSSRVLKQLDISNNKFSGEVGGPERFFFPALQTLNLRSSGIVQGGTNSRGEHLPEGFAFVEQNELVTQQEVPNLLCKPVKPAAGFQQNLTVEISAQLFQYETCVCGRGTQMKRRGSGASLQVTCVPSTSVSWTVIAIPIFFGIIALLAAAGAWYIWRQHKNSVSAVAYKRKGPPGKGSPATLLCTDVVGSTELWEWDKGCMLEAIALHDRTLRSHLTKFCGYEVATEGDAFTMVFHHPADAVGWAVATQQALVTAKWPLRLEQHHQSCIRLKTFSAMQGYANHQAAEAAGQSEPKFYGESNSTGTSIEALYGKQAVSEWLMLDEVADASILHMGLNVRMAITSGTADEVTENPISKCTEYTGHLLNLARTILEIPTGGQILLDGHAFRGIVPDLADLAAPASLDFTRCREARRSTQSMDALRVLRAFSSKNQKSFSSRSMTAASLGAASAAAANESQRSSTDDVFAHNARQSLESSVLSAIPESTASSCTQLRSPQHDPERGKLGAAGNRSPVGSLGALSASFRHMFRPRSLECGKPLPSLEGEAASLQVMDMGTHVLPKILGSHLLVQVVVPGLEERAFAQMELKSLVTQPGYFQAPAALYCPLGHRPTMDALPPVTLVFCAIDGILDMKAFNVTATELALTMYRDQVRRCLTRCSAYECQEAQGEFMLAFAEPLAAVEFCLAVQEVMMQGMWSPEILQLPSCMIQTGQGDSIVWNGPRVRMGLSEGQPVRVTPHTTSGRADYFGPVVNRASRFCFSAAHGGQIMMPLQLAEQVVKVWTGQQLQTSPTGYPQLLSKIGSISSSSSPAEARQAHVHTSPPDVSPVQMDRGLSSAASIVPKLTRRRSSAAAAAAAAAAAQQGPLVPNAEDSDSASKLVLPATADSPAQASNEDSTTGKTATWRMPVAVAMSSLFAPTNAGSSSSRKFHRASSSLRDREAPSQRATVDDAPSWTAAVPPAHTAPSADGAPPSLEAAPAASGPRGMLADWAMHQQRRAQAPEAAARAPPRPDAGEEAMPLYSPSASLNSGSLRAMQRASLRSMYWGDSRRAEARKSLGARQPSNVAAISAAVSEREVELHHCGIYLFKGLMEPSCVVQVNYKSLSGRLFPAALPSKKAKLLGSPKGLMCTIEL